MGLVADIFIEWLVRVIIRGVMVFRSRNWPPMDASVTGAECSGEGLGCDVAKVSYRYRAGNATHSGIYKKPFLVGRSGKQFAEQFRRGTKFRIRVNPKDPSISVPWPASWPGKN
jgi:hypothetical protein